MGSPVDGRIVKVQIPNCCKSPLSGFWPHPHKENIYRKKAPWKTKKNLQGKHFIYDCVENTILYTGYTGYNEIPISNKFDILSDKDQMGNINYVNPDPPGDQINNSNIILSYNSPQDTLYSDLNINNNLSNNCYNYVYEKNKNLCSGYFPSFITLSDPKYDLISQNNLPNNISNNYYLKIKNGKYLK